MSDEHQEHSAPQCTKKTSNAASMGDGFVIILLNLKRGFFELLMKWKPSVPDSSQGARKQPGRDGLSAHRTFAAGLSQG